MTFALSLATFVLLSIGFLLLINVNPQKLSSEIAEITESDKPIGKKAKIIQDKKKTNLIIRFIKETKSLMEYMHMESRFAIVCIVSAIMVIASFVLALSLKNVWLIPAFVTASFSCPFVFIRFMSYRYTRKLQAELETTLSQITISYLRLNDIVKAVEENIPNTNPPIRQPLIDFVNQIKFIDSNERNAIQDLSDKIDNDIFKEWCDGLIKCVKNRNMKYLLQPTLNKFSTLRKIENKMANEIVSIRMQYFVILALVFVNYPLIKSLDEEWYAILETTLQGKIVVGLVALIAIICTLILVALTKPIKYKV